jgi:hypothetical protein
MGFTLYNLFKACLLMINALAILHPQRFLRKCEYRTDWVSVDVATSSSGPVRSLTLPLTLPLTLLHNLVQTS